ncbi:MAG: DUF4430 domain-containing protein [Methanobacteriota archaeon]
MNRGLVFQLVALIAVVGFLCFAGGYLVAGGITKQAGQYAYGENITVNVKIADLGIDKQVTIYSGMTPFDALAKCAKFTTEYSEGFGASWVTIIGGLDQGWGYSVNGEQPLVGMGDYQLKDGDTLELFKLSF